MAVKYISYLQTEKLFTQWPVIQGIKESLQIEINTIRAKNTMATDGEYIDTLVLGNRIMDTAPPSTKITDKTGNVAASYRQTMKRDYSNALKRITEEKLYIELVDDKLDVAFKRLPLTQQQLLKLFYWENKTWAEVLEEFKCNDCYLSKYQAQIQRQYGIERMKNISKITIKAYDYVMDMMGAR